MLAAVSNIVHKLLSHKHKTDVCLVHNLLSNKHIKQMFTLPVDETLVSRHLGEGSPVPLAATEVFAVIPCRLT